MCNAGAVAVYSFIHTFKFWSTLLLGKWHLYNIFWRNLYCKCWRRDGPKCIL